MISANENIYIGEKEELCKFVNRFRGGRNFARIGIFLAGKIFEKLLSLDIFSIKGIYGNTRR